MNNLRIALRSKIDSITVWFTIIGLSIFFIFWIMKIDKKVNAIYSSTVDKSEIENYDPDFNTRN